MLPRTIALASGLAFALLFSQAPEFAQQYRQRLGGAIDELRGVVTRFDADARGAGMGHDDALRRMEASDDFGRRRAVSVAMATARLDRLESQRAGMAEAGPFRRILFLAGADPALASNAYRDFEPAVPTTLEGVVSAGTGFLAGFGLVRLCAAPFRRRRRLAAQAQS